MSISTSTVPPALGAARSPLHMRVVSDTWQVQPTSNASGTLASFTVQFTGVPALGDILTISNNFAVSALTCATGAGDAGTAFEQGANTTEQATFFARDAARNYDLATRYRITAGGTVVTFVARDYGEDYNPILINSSGAGVTGTGLGFSLDFVYQDNFSLNMRPTIADADAPLGLLQLPEFSGFPDETKGVVWDLAPILRPYLSPDWPDFTTAGYAFPHVNSVKEYTVEYFARQGDPVLPLAVETFGPKLAWLASYQSREYTQFHNWVARATGETGPPPHMFFTWRNRKTPRYVTKVEQHHLGWFHWPMLDEALTLTVQAKVYYTDGTSSAWTDRYDFTPDSDGIPRGTLGTICTGYTQLNLLAMTAGLVIERYSVRINTSTGPKSEEIDFYMALERGGLGGFNDTFIWFISSLGCTESVRCAGEWKEGTNHTFQEFQRPIVLNDVTGTDHQAESNYTSETLKGQRFLEVVIGYHAIEEHLAISDILNAPRGGLKHVDYSTNRVLPIRLVEAEELPIRKRGGTDEHLYAFRLRFLADDPENAVSMPVQTVVNEVVENEDDGVVS